jgi:hypothetical protein
MTDNILFWDRLYKSFDGILSGCNGNLCPKSCCRMVSVLICSEEKKYLNYIYGEKVNRYLKNACDSYFLLTSCSDNGKCLFFESRPIVCRTYPCVGIVDEKSNIMEFQIDYDYCPACEDITEEYIMECSKIWEEIAQYKGNDFKNKRDKNRK